VPQCSYGPDDVYANSNSNYKTSDLAVLYCVGITEHHVWLSCKQFTEIMYTQKYDI